MGHLKAESDCPLVLPALDYLGVSCRSTGPRCVRRGDLCMRVWGGTGGMY